MKRVKNLIPLLSFIDEEWRPVAGYPQYYVSSYGRVFSGVRGTGRILLTPIGKRGYKWANLYCSRKSKIVCVHRLVATAFIGCKPGDIVDHIDRDPLNNMVQNLRLVDKRTNALNSTKSRSNCGARGVHKSPLLKSKPYEAYVTTGGQRKKSLGRYATLDEAVAARKHGERIYYGIC